MCPFGGFAFLPVLVLCIAVPVFFWWFAGAIFQDTFRLRLPHWAGLAFLVALTLAADRANDVSLLAPHATFLKAASRIAALGFVLLALWTALRDRADDLLESRRRFRDWFTALVGLQMVIVVSAELALAGQQPPGYLATLNVATILIITHLAAHAFVRVRSQLFEAPPLAAAASGDPTAKDRALLNKLRSAMEQEHAYRTEGLTIALLAKKLDTQEHVLRKAINQHLGFRNFNEFLNSHRIREAAQRLRSDKDQRVPILTIALEVGYGSIGPFNRAFKASMRMTPTEYRAAGRADPAVAPPREPDRMTTETDEN